jgi:hypothetical protein
MFDDRFFFIANQTFISGMGVNAKHGDAGLINTEIFLEALMNNLKFTDNSFLGYVFCDITYRYMFGKLGYSETAAQSIIATSFTPNMFFK